MLLAYSVSAYLMFCFKMTGHHGSFPLIQRTSMRKLSISIKIRPFTEATSSVASMKHLLHYTGLVVTIRLNLLFW